MSEKNKKICEWAIRIARFVVITFLFAFALGIAPQFLTDAQAAMRVILIIAYVAYVSCVLICELIIPLNEKGPSNTEKEDDN